ncbi:MAG: polyketide cyclase [Chloroflexi bacterium]|nr:polyketide cyclase [Chloroflexota bacterium]
MSLPRWWPSVYLAVCEVAPGEADGRGRVIELFTTGWLPYTLRWRFVVTDSRRPYGISLQASGDLVGRGQWTLTQAGAYADIVYDWRVRAEKPILRYGSFIFKPIFAANHRWAMARGEEGLKLELKRRRAGVTVSPGQGG